MQCHELDSGEPPVQYEEIVYVEPGSEQVVEMSTTECIPTASGQPTACKSLGHGQPLSPDHQQVVYLFISCTQ